MNRRRLASAALLGMTVLGLGTASAGSASAAEISPRTTAASPLDYGPPCLSVPPGWAGLCSGPSFPWPWLS